MDLHSMAVQWSDEVATIFRVPLGYTAVMDSSLDFVVPAFRAAAREALENCRLHGEPWDLELQVVTVDGQHRWVRSVGQAQRDSMGGINRLLGTLQDITRSKQAEAERLATLNQQANFARSEFLARMSHELRTPLNAILGFAEILETDTAPALPASHRKRVERIRSAGGHLLSIINDLLDVSRIETGALRLQVMAVNLTDEVHEALRLVSAQAQAREVILDWTLPQHPQQRSVAETWVWGDATRLRQVVLNLLTNAIKYNRPHGKVFIAVELANEHVRLLVKDTGLGMTPAQLAQLFQPFNRLGKEHSTIEGTGIGLAITQHLVELMGGSISVISEHRVGSQFCVLLKTARPPAATADGGQIAELEPAVTEDSDITAASVPEPNAGLSEVHWSRVLYIEDNAVNRALIEGYVALRPGIALEMAVNGQSGIDAAEHQTPDLILIDMMLPDLHGLQVIERLRRVPALQAVRCIAVSANAMPQQIDEARAAGFDGYLTKPVSMQLLLAELDRLV